MSIIWLCCLFKSVNPDSSNRWGGLFWALWFLTRTLFNSPVTNSLCCLDWSYIWSTHKHVPWIPCKKKKKPMFSPPCVHKGCLLQLKALRCWLVWVTLTKMKYEKGLLAFLIFILVPCLYSSQASNSSWRRSEIAVPIIFIVNDYNSCSL